LTHLSPLRGVVSDELAEVGGRARKNGALLGKSRPILNNSPGDWVYDPFCGSGTTTIAAEMTSRRMLGIETYPHVDLALTRWDVFTGTGAILAAGESL
jgi:DNA methylase